MTKICNITEEVVLKSMEWRDSIHVVILFKALTMFYYHPQQKMELFESIEIKYTPSQGRKSRVKPSGEAEKLYNI